MRAKVFISALLLVVLELAGLGQGTNIVLKISWVKQVRDRLSIDATVTVLGLNSGKEDDGDSHGGSRKNTIGLPMVAEILNGRAPAQQDARAKLDPGGDPSKHVYGAWRLWFEHPPATGGTQCQTFSGTPPQICSHQSLEGADSNPKHSFEIHPVFAVEGIDIARSSMELTADNTSVKDTDKAFTDYTGKNKILTIARTATALTLTSIMIQDNYVRTHIRVTKARTTTTRLKTGAVDGGFVIADVISSSDKDTILKKDARVFYYKDSIPGDALDKAKKGDELDVLAMPRLNLTEVLALSDGKTFIKLPAVPFEFVIVALLKAQ
jgi:hypothetical protein